MEDRIYLIWAQILSGKGKDSATAWATGEVLSCVLDYIRQIAPVLPHECPSTAPWKILHAKLKAIGARVDEGGLWDEDRLSSPETSRDAHAGILRELVACSVRDPFRRQMLREWLATQSDEVRSGSDFRDTGNLAGAFYSELPSRPSDVQIETMVRGLEANSDSEKSHTSFMLLAAVYAKHEVLLAFPNMNVAPTELEPQNADQVLELQDVEIPQGGEPIVSLSAGALGQSAEPPVEVPAVNSVVAPEISAEPTVEGPAVNLVVALDLNGSESLVDRVKEALQNGLAMLPPNIRVAVFICGRTQSQLTSLEKPFEMHDFRNTLCILAPSGSHNFLGMFQSVRKEMLKGASARHVDSTQLLYVLLSSDYRLLRKDGRREATKKVYCDYMSRWQKEMKFSTRILPVSPNADLEFASSLSAACNSTAPDMSMIEPEVLAQVIQDFVNP